LWPERLVAVIHPDAYQLYDAGGKALGHCLPAASVDFSLTKALELLFDEYSPDGRADLDLVVSDSLARLIPLPWQDSLKGDEQHEAYARACLDQAGFDLDGEWLVHAAYRHFRGIGLGFALPRSLVFEAKNHLIERQIHLRSMMPMSAHAYWRSANGSRANHTLLLLSERSRLSALLFDGRKCTGIEVQPMGTDLSDAARRLGHVVNLILPSISRVYFWSPGASEQKAELIKSRFPAPSFEVVPGLGWS
jgi:hypothetical protein